MTKWRSRWSWTFTHDGTGSSKSADGGERSGSSDGLSGGVEETGVKVEVALVRLTRGGARREVDPSLGDAGVVATGDEELAGSDPKVLACVRKETRVSGPT